MSKSIKVTVFFKSIVGDIALKKNATIDDNGNIYVDVYGTDPKIYSRFLLHNNNTAEFIGNVIEGRVIPTAVPVVVLPYRWELEEKENRDE